MGNSSTREKWTIRCETEEDRLRYIHRHDTWEDILAALKQLLLSAAIAENLGEPMGPNHENVVAARQAITKAEVGKQ